MKGQQEESIFEQIKKVSGAVFISDMRDADMRDSVCFAVKATPADMFTSEQWYLLAEYVLNEKQFYDASVEPEKAKADIITRIE